MNRFQNALYHLRLKLLRLIIGRLSVVANVDIYGGVVVGDGIVYNLQFHPKDPGHGHRSVLEAFVYASHILTPSDCRIVIDHCTRVDH